MEGFGYMLATIPCGASHPKYWVKLNCLGQAQGFMRRVISGDIRKQEPRALENVRFWPILSTISIDSPSVYLFYTPQD